MHRLPHCLHFTATRAGDKTDRGYIDFIHLALPLRRVGRFDLMHERIQRSAQFRSVGARPVR
jgi:hypothetical protein